MADKVEVHRVMTYLSADADFEITPEKRAVWCDQFIDVSYEELFQAARILIARKIYGKFPRISDMWNAIIELRRPEKSNWAEAWDDWVTISRKYGCYDCHKAVQELKEVNPLAERALGTMAREWFTTYTQDVPTFRAQFRQRYEAIITSKEQKESRPADLRLGTDGKLLTLVRETSEKLTLEHKKNGTK